MESTVTPSLQSTTQVMGKGFGVRAGAYILDVIVIWLVASSISLIAGILIGIVSAVTGQEINLDSQSSSGLDFFFGLAVLVASTLYFMLFEWLYGATPGKLILGMRVVMENGTPCTLGAAFIRALLRYIDGLFFGIPAYVNMKEPLLQRIGDKAAKTIVVNSKDSFIQSARPWWWFLVATAIYIGMQAIVSFAQVISMIR